MGSFTADVCNKDLYDLKILEATDYTKSVGKKKSISKALVLHQFHQFPDKDLCGQSCLKNSGSRSGKKFHEHMCNTYILFTIFFSLSKQKDNLSDKIFIENQPPTNTNQITDSYQFVQPKYSFLPYQAILDSSKLKIQETSIQCNFVGLIENREREFGYMAFLDVSSHRSVFYFSFLCK